MTVAEPTRADGLDEAGKELKALMEELLGRDILERIEAAESRSGGAVKELQRAQQTQHVQLKKEVQNQGELLARLEESLQPGVNAAVARILDRLNALQTETNGRTDAAVQEVRAAMAAHAAGLSQQVAAAVEGTETRVVLRLDGVTAALARQSEAQAVLLERISLLERRQFWLMIALVTSAVILIGVLGLVLVRISALADLLRLYR